MLISEIRDSLSKGVQLSELPLRVTFYGRVSTDMDEQLSSLAHQIDYFTNKINENPRWKRVQGYIDEGITGTSVKKRKDFLRMIDDAKRGLFDLILTKEVSRFARDIVDSIQYTRKLLKYNVGVFFEDIGLNTVEPDAEFRLSIMATVAQEESRKISQRVKFGYRQAAINGARHGSDAPTGYVFNNENNGYSIDPDKSKMILYLFNRYAENNAGMKRIATELSHMGFKSKSGGIYSTHTLTRIIRHPVYTGNIVNGKSATESYRDGKVTRKPRTEWILVHDEHRVPPLVSQELWDKCNAILDKRGETQIGILNKTYDSRGTTRYAYSGKIRCGEHNKVYHHTRQTQRADGSPGSDYYRCPNYKEHGVRGCESPHLYTKELNRMMKQVFGNIGGRDKPEAADRILAAIQRAISPHFDEREIEALARQKARLEAKKQKLIHGWLDGLIDNTAYKTTSQKIEAQMSVIGTRLDAVKNADIAVAQTKCDIETLCAEVASEMEMESDSVIEGLVRRYLKEIRVVHTGNQGEYLLEVYLAGSAAPISGGTKRARKYSTR